MPRVRGVLPAGWRRGAVENVPRRAAPARRRQLRGHVRGRPRARLRGGQGLHRRRGRRRVFAVSLFDLATGELAAVLEADTLGQRRTGAASGVAAKYLARPGARTLGVIGCGWQAESQVEAIRAAVPTIERVVAYCRTPERLRGFCAQVGRRAGRVRSGRGRAGRRRHGHDLARSGPPRRVAARGRARLRRRRERPRARASSTTSSSSARRFVCCDSKRAGEARVGRPDRAGRAAGVLDWLEVHELQEVVAGERAGPRVGRRTSSSSSRTGSPPGTSRSPPSSFDARARARRRRRASSRCRSPRGRRRSCPCRSP